MNRFDNTQPILLKSRDATSPSRSTLSPASPPRAVCSADAEGLSSILDSANNLAIWQRPPLEPSLAFSLQAHANALPPPRMFEGSPDSFDPGQLTTGLSDRRAAGFVAEDARRLVERFRTLSGRDHVAVQLVAVADSACRKLHVDYYGLRMLVTYVGPGTEWVPEEELSRDQLSQMHLDADTNNALILRAGCSPRRVPENHVIVLKGEHFRGNAGRGAVHRSPPMPDGASPRLLLKLDVAQCGC